MPDTLSDMILGYGIGLGIVFVMIASLWWRYRSLSEDEATLKQLEVDIRQEKNR